MNKKRVLAAMSGGVDSSVTALLLKQQGYEVIGITMRLWEEETDVCSRSCCSFDAVQDARKVCYELDIPHYTLNMKDLFRQQVIDNFIDEYAQGKTPNPCIRCNKWLKLDGLLQKARELDCYYVATGHYAKIEQQKGLFRLKKAFNKAKDQSYVLYHFDQQSLPHILLPLADFASKDDIRKIALEGGLLIANKPDSQDICFIPNNDTKDFILRQNPKLKKTGDVILQSTGQVIGKHEGVAFYTVGQRKGLGIAWSEPLYIIKLDAEKNHVIVGSNKDIFTTTLIADDMSFVEKPLTKGQTINTSCKIRYSHKESSAQLTMLEDNTAKIVFETAQRAITPGQSVVLYDGDYVIGGGIIKETM